MPISKETKQRICEDAIEYAEFNTTSPSALGWAKSGYIAGGEAEAERAQGLVECLNSIKAIGHPDERVLNLIVLTLTNYNNSK